MGSKRFDITKNKAPSLLEKKDTPAIPPNSGGRRQAREGGFIMVWMNNRKRGTPLKTTLTNKNMKGKGKSPTKSAAALTASTKKPPEKKLSPTTMPPPRTVGGKYTNWKHEPAKSALARDVEAKLKVLYPQLSAGEIIIPDENFKDHVRYAMDKAKKKRVLLIIYLKDFSRGETKTITTELDRFYMQQLITLRDLKIMECQ